VARGPLFHPDNSCNLEEKGRGKGGRGTYASDLLTVRLKREKGGSGLKKEGKRIENNLAHSPYVLVNREKGEREQYIHASFGFTYARKKERTAQEEKKNTNSSPKLAALFQIHVARDVRRKKHL